MRMHKNKCGSTAFVFICYGGVGCISFQVRLSAHVCFLLPLRFEFVSGLLPGGYQPLNTGTISSFAAFASFLLSPVPAML